MLQQQEQRREPRTPPGVEQAVLWSVVTVRAWHRPDLGCNAATTQKPQSVSLGRTTST
jgi:hypothetical protein